MLREFTATTVSEFVAAIDRIGEEWCDADGPSQAWYRGQADARWTLTPRAYRYRDISEDDLRSQFKRRASPFLTEGRPNDDWEWYFLMQHYGIPTRLLDWTEGALFALYFAVRGPKLIDATASSAAVWVVDPWWLNSLTIGREYLFDSHEPEVQGLCPRALRHYCQNCLWRFVHRTSRDALQRNLAALPSTGKITLGSSRYRPTPRPGSLISRFNSLR